MKTVKTLLACAALLALTLNLRAQSDQQPLFFIVDYMKSTPGKTAEYVKNEREIWKKVHQERKKRGLIESWYMYSVWYAGTQSEYDYVTVTVVRGFDKLENPWGDLFSGGLEKLLTKEQFATGVGVEALRNLLRTEVFALEDIVSNNPAGAAPAKYLRVNYMDVPAGGWDRYIHMETKLVKPLHVEMMKGGGKSGWGLYSLGMPSGDAMPYDAVSIDYYNKWSDMTGGTADFRKALEKVHPGMSEQYLTDEINASRSLVRAELWEVIDYVQ